MSILPSIGPGVSGLTVSRGALYSYSLYGDTKKEASETMENNDDYAATLTQFPSFRLRYNLCKNALSDSEKKVAQYFLDHPEAVYQSITDAVKDAGVGYGTVNRFCRRLGCSGFQDFKILLAHDLALFSDDNTRGRSNTLDQHYKRIVERLDATRQLCTDELLETVAALLHSANHVLIGAIAGSAPAAIALDYRLSRIGLPCTVITDGFMFGIRAAALKPGDVVFTVNFSGSTKALVQGVKVAREAGVKVVAITNFITAPITEYADYCLYTAEDRDPLSVELHSSLPAVFLVDALFEKILTLRDDASEVVRHTFSAVADQKM